jgi:hypothetical protein
VALPGRSVAWTSTTNATAYARPNALPPIGGAVQIQSDAQIVANLLGGLWGQRRRLYDVVLPLALGITHEIGDAVTIAYPIDDMRGGRVGLIVGEQFRSQDSTITYQVLV